LGGWAQIFIIPLKKKMHNQTSSSDPLGLLKYLI
jgi:hypothetical protein